MKLFFSFLDLIVFVGAQWPMMKLKGRSIDPSRKSKDRNIDVEILQVTGPTEEATREREEMNNGTLWYPKWKLGFEQSGS